MPEHFELKKKGVAVQGLVGMGGRCRTELPCAVHAGKRAMSIESRGLGEHH